MEVHHLDLPPVLKSLVLSESLKENEKDSSREDPLCQGFTHVPELCIFFHIVIQLASFLTVFYVGGNM